MEKILESLLYQIVTSISSLKEEEQNLKIERFATLLKDKLVDGSCFVYNESMGKIDMILREEINRYLRYFKNE